MSHPRGPLTVSDERAAPARFVPVARWNRHLRVAVDHAQLHAAAADPAAAVATSRATPLSAIFGVLRDGELVLFVLKPSLWFIGFQCVRFAAAVLLVLLCVRVFGERWLPIHRLVYIDLGAFLILGRLMVAVLQWMGRYYVLTDRRILRLSGILAYEVYDCPLRKIAHTQITTSVKERLCHVGSIEIHPCDQPDNGRGDSTRAIGVWQTIERPAEVHERILEAVRRAKMGGG